MLISGISFGQILATDDFAYPDGSLVGNGAWANHSGNAGDLLVSSGQVVIQHGTPSEDANLPFTAGAGNIYFGIDFTVSSTTPIPGSDNEYFAHFKDSGNNFRGRLDIVPANVGGGDFTVGISSATSTAEAIWATDLTYGQTYRAVVRYDQDLGIAELWINATTSADTSILGTEAGATAIESFGLRQSDSDNNETILVDNLVVSKSFNESLSTKESEIEGFAMYPNPTNTGFVTFSSLNNDAMNVQVFDILGKQVKNETLTSNTLNVSDLNTGVYIVKITQNNASITKKLMIR